MNSHAHLIEYDRNGDPVIFDIPTHGYNNGIFWDGYISATVQEITEALQAKRETPEPLTLEKLQQMDRLTHSYLHGGYYASIFKVSACGENECNGEIIDKLADYENAEEQRLLLRLPCKAGETILRQREKLTQIEMRVLENFIHSMPKTYRKRNSNWGIVQDILQRSTSTAGMTSCIEKCRELGIDPDGYTLERVKTDE